MGFRYYDPEVGRFITPDPIGIAGGINIYAYCHNDPVNYVDPNGLDTLAPPLTWGKHGWLGIRAQYLLAPAIKDELVGHGFLWSEHNMGMKSIDFLNFIYPVGKRNPLRPDWQAAISRGILPINYWDVKQWTFCGNPVGKYIELNPDNSIKGPALGKITEYEPFPDYDRVYGTEGAYLVSWSPRPGIINYAIMIPDDNDDNELQQKLEELRRFQEEDFRVKMAILGFIAGCALLSPEVGFFIAEQILTH